MNIHQLFVILFQSTWLGIRCGELTRQGDRLTWRNATATDVAKDWVSLAQQENVIVVSLFLILILFLLSSSLSLLLFRLIIYQHGRRQSNRCRHHNYHNMDHISIVIILFTQAYTIVYVMKMDWHRIPSSWWIFIRIFIKIDIIDMYGCLYAGVSI